VKESRDEQRDVEQMGDSSTKQEEKDRKSVCTFKTRGERKATKGNKRRRPSRTNHDVKGMQENGGKKFDQFGRDL